MSAVKERYGRSGVATLRIKAEHLDKVKVYGLPVHEATEVLPENVCIVDDELFVREHNAYVNTGLNNALDLEWGLIAATGHIIGFIGVSSNTAAVTSGTVNLNGPSGGTAANTIIKSISPTASRSGQTTTGGATFVNADFTSGVFVWAKIGLLNTSTDAGTGLIDVIGGTGGSAPYNRTFSLDLTAAGTFSVTAQIAVTATAV